MMLFNSLVMCERNKSVFDFGSAVINGLDFQSLIQIAVLEFQYTIFIV